MTILIIVDWWKHYLEYDQFIIKIDHESLKYLLEHKIHTPM